MARNNETWSRSGTDGAIAEADTANYTSHTHTPSAGTPNFAVVIFYARLGSGAGAPTTATYGGQALTLRATGSSSDDRRAWIYTTDSPPSGGQTANFQTSVGIYRHAGCAIYTTDADGTLSVRASANAAGALGTLPDTSPAVSVTSDTGDLTVGALIVNHRDAVITSGDTETSRGMIKNSTNSSSSASAGHLQSAAGASASVTHNWSVATAGTTWAAAAISLEESGGGGGGSSIPARANYYARKRKVA